MNTKYKFAPEQDGKTQEQIVYVRPVEVSDLPQEIQAQVQVEGIEKLYAVHNSNGERLALVRDRSLAFVLARQNDLTPVTVH